MALALLIGIYLFFVGALIVAAGYAMFAWFNWSSIWVRRITNGIAFALLLMVSACFLSAK